jgi:hypothetical protein
MRKLIDGIICIAIIWAIIWGLGWIFIEVSLPALGYK